MRGYKGLICGFEKILKYAEILINENLSMSQQITIMQYSLNLDEELLSKE